MRTIKQTAWMFLALVTIILAAALILPSAPVLAAGRFLWRKALMLRLRARFMV